MVQSRLAGARHSSADQPVDAVEDHDPPGHDQHPDEHRRSRSRAASALKAFRRRSVGLGATRWSVIGSQTSRTLMTTTTITASDREFGLGPCSRDHLQRGDERDTRGEHEQADDERAQRRRVGDHPGHDAHAALSRDRAAAACGPRRRCQPPSSRMPRPSRRPYRGACWSGMVQADAAQRHQDDHSHDEAHDHRAGEVEHAGQPGSCGAEVDGGNQQRCRGQRRKQRQPGRLRDHMGTGLPASGAQGDLSRVRLGRRHG